MNQRYIVRNVIGPGVESVGTNPLHLDGAVASAAIRTGDSEQAIAESVAQLSALVPSVTIPGVDAAHNAARIELATVPTS